MQLSTSVYVTLTQQKWSPCDNETNENEPVVKFGLWNIWRNNRHSPLPPAPRNTHTHTHHHHPIHPSPPPCKFYRRSWTTDEATQIAIWKSMALVRVQHHIQHTSPANPCLFCFAVTKVTCDGIQSMAVYIVFCSLHQLVKAVVREIPVSARKKKKKKKERKPTDVLCIVWASWSWLALIAT